MIHELDSREFHAVDGYYLRQWDPLTLHPLQLVNQPPQEQSFIVRKLRDSQDWGAELTVKVDLLEPGKGSADQLPVPKVGPILIWPAYGEGQAPTKTGTNVIGSI